MLRIKNIGAIAVALTMVFAGAGIASAADYTVSGRWVSQKGSFFRIPSETFPFANDRHIKGGGPATGSGATLVLQTLFWNDHHTSLDPVQNNNVVQLGTDWDFDGPATGVMAQGKATLKPQLFTAAHPTRTNAVFKYCAGAGNNPDCANNLIGGANGTKAGRVQYTTKGGGNTGFGGTMQYIIGGPGVIVLKIGTIGGQDRFAHNPLAGTAGNPQAQGGSYANTNFVTLGAGPASTGAVCGGLSCGPASHGVITVVGSVTGVAPPSGQTSTGFPMTTGTVTVSIPPSVNGVGSFPMTLVAKGSDSRNAGGHGNISLVAGALSHRQNGDITPNMEHVQLTVAVGGAVPAMSPMGLAAGAALFVLAFGYVVRRRL
jgi:hypothetical protein